MSDGYLLLLVDGPASLDSGYRGVQRSIRKLVVGASARQGTISRSNVDQLLAHGGTHN